MDTNTEEMLPEEIQMLLEQKRAQRRQHIDGVANVIRKKRDAAVKGRAESGIENDWVEDEEAYQGIDDANRDTGTTLKPAVSGGSLIDSRPVRKTRSNVFLNITRPYVDAAAAKVADMLLPTDDKNFAIAPTPIPDLIDQQDDDTEVPGYTATESVPPAPGQPEVPPTSRPAQVKDFVEQALQQARKKAESAEREIDDWLAECMFHAEMRKVIESASRLGSGVVKGPIPVKRRARRVTETPEGLMLAIQEKIAPGSKAVDVWNCYPDPNCGEDIHDGQYFFEKDKLTAKGLKDLKGLPGYLDELIDEILEEGPKSSFTSDRNPSAPQVADDTLFEVWYFYGYLDAEDIGALGLEIKDVKGSTAVIVTLVNDKPIKCAINPLDSGCFPYDIIPWQRRSGMPWGTGVSRQIRVPQRMINGATRNMMDNAGLAGGPILVVRRNLIQPADGVWELAPRKTYYVAEDADVRTVADAITAINIPSMQADLMAIIQFALKMAEDVTGLPMLMQGQLGKAPDTVGGMEMLTNNANSVLRRVARLFDDKVTVPHITRYYEWLMMYGENDASKGDFQIVARGSSALVERAVQNQTIQQMGQLVLNPSFGLSPSKWMAEYLKSQRLNPDKFEMDDDEKKRMAQAQQQQQDPRLQAAQIKAQTDIQVAQIREGSENDREAQFIAAENERTQIEHDARMQELYVKRELALLEYANTQKVSLDKIKADLSKEAMRLTTQKQLAGLNAALKVPQVATPGTEPPGRAPAGEAFQK